MRQAATSPFWRGGLLALLAALAFGVTTPLVQRFGKDVGPFVTAALLYAGAAAASSLMRSGTEAPVRAAHLPRIGAVAVIGAALAPAALAWGLQRSSGAAASLLLNLEAVFTVLLARLLYKEPMGRQMGLAVVVMTVGGGLLVLGGVSSPTSSGWGLVAVGFATLCWAADNTVTRPLADLDPGRVVQLKAGIGAALSTAVALTRREALPSLEAAVALFVCGAIGYGLSLALYLRAQRLIGAGRTGSVFAAAPFVGAVVAWGLGDRGADVRTGVAAALFLVGVVLHLTEKHAHAHAHKPLSHEHAHRHDDDHHDDHVHDPPVAGEHSHAHSHVVRTHAHVHGADLHHGHEHDGRREEDRKGRRAGSKGSS